LAEYILTTVSEEKYLHEILALQKANLPNNISAEERAEQGFVTCDHSFDLLRRMNNPFPHVIALSDDKVVGYALVMLPDHRNALDVLLSMFAKIDQQQYQGQSIKDSRYFTMGQVCIAKPHRSQGIFRKLYQKMKNEMSENFDYCITEVATDNVRSLKAHAKVGFTNLHSYTDSTNGKSWEIIIWDWS